MSYVLEATGNGASEYLDKIGFRRKYGEASIEQVIKVARSRELSPLSSGAGRLFDAVSALLGLCSINTFEGEAAMTLESYAAGHVDGLYPVEFIRENGYTIVDFSRTIIEVLQDFMTGPDARSVAAKFHNTVASVIETVVADLCAEQGIMDVALSGGTFQNLYLLSRTEHLLTSRGLNVFVNRKMPCNDGGISLGQAYIVRERLRRGQAS